jgi:uncharacterized protein (TIGR03435 family)
VNVYSMTVAGLTGFAYGARVVASGEPGWVDGERFDIVAKVDDSLIAGWDQLPEMHRDELIKPMIRALLEDRFKLQVKRETNVESIYILEVAKGGAKIKPNEPVVSDANSGAKSAIGGPTLHLERNEFTATNVSMSFWANALSGQRAVQKLVRDETGLTGNYNFTFTFDMSPDGPGPTLFEALEDQLGLRLVAGKWPVDSLLITHVEEPSEN